MAKGRRFSKKLNRRSKNKSRKSMRGGDLNDDIVNQLTQNKFTTSQIGRLNTANVSVDNINKGIDFYNDNAPELITGITINLEESLSPLDGKNFDPTVFVVPSASTYASTTTEPVVAPADTSVAQPVDTSAAQPVDTSAAQPVDTSAVANASTPDLSTTTVDPNAAAASTVDPNAAVASTTPDLSAASTTSPDPNAASTTTPDLSAAPLPPTSSATTSGVSAAAANAALPEDDDDLNNPQAAKTTGGRRSRRRNNRRGRKTLKGGKMYGNGYGANCSDPNYSIYNTNMKTLFPYNPK
jgi:hypothetical protein